MYIVSWIYRPFEPYSWIASALIRSEMYSFVKRKNPYFHHIYIYLYLYIYNVYIYIYICRFFIFWVPILELFWANATPRKWTPFLNPFLDSCWNWFLLKVRLHLGRTFFFRLLLGRTFSSSLHLGRTFFFRLHLGRTFLFSMENCSFGRFSSCFYSAVLEN